MIDRANADARIADGYWQDEIIGALYRRGIATWRELSKHDFNSIASWSPKLRWALESFKEELEGRGLDLLPFDAFALLTNGTKNALAAGGITSLAGIQRMSASELGALKGVGSQTISDIEECSASPIWSSDLRLQVMNRYRGNSLLLRATGLPGFPSKRRRNGSASRRRGSRPSDGS